MAFGDTASSQGYAAAAAAEGGGPIDDNASIYFGAAQVGASTLSNTPTLTPSSSAVPSAAEGGGGITAPTAVAGAPLPVTSSGLSLSTILLVGALLVGGALIVHMVHHRQG